MISALVIEKPGAWRASIAGLIFFILVSPILILISPLISPLSNQPWTTITAILGDGFIQSLMNSLFIASTVGAVGLILGLPTGTYVGLFNVIGTKLILILMAVPLVMPSFLWAIGNSNVLSSLNFSHYGGWSGFLSIVYSYSCFSVPLVFWVSFLSTKNITRSQIDSTRLIGGPHLTYRCAIQSSFRLVLLIAILSGLFTIADPGPTQIFGIRSVAAELLISFSALYDFDLSSRQCLFSSFASFLVAIPFVVYCSENLSQALLSKDSVSISPNLAPKNKYIPTIVIALIFLVQFGTPLAGLLMYLRSGPHIMRAISELYGTLADTLIFSVGGGLVATTIGLIFSTLALRQQKLRAFLIGSSILFFSLPSALFALSFVKLGATVPAVFDLIFRSKWTVCLALGIRFFPLAFLILLRQIHLSSPTWVMAGATLGLSAGNIIRKLFCPFLIPSVLTSIFICSLLGASDITSTVLLRPPGADSFVVRIFTIMANAPEALVAAMCLVLPASLALFFFSVGFIFRKLI